MTNLEWEFEEFDKDPDKGEKKQDKEQPTVTQVDPPAVSSALRQLANHNAPTSQKTMTVPGCTCSGRCVGADTNVGILSLCGIMCWTDMKELPAVAAV